VHEGRVLTRLRSAPTMSIGPDNWRMAELVPRCVSNRIHHAIVEAGTGTGEDAGIPPAGDLQAGGAW